MVLLMAIACGTRPGARETEKSGLHPAEIREVKEPLPVILPVQRKESAGEKIKQAKGRSPEAVTDETPKNHASIAIDWGRAATLDGIIGMAKNSEIRQIEWHVMPNVIRAQASDGRIFHIRNENKGIDIRNALLNAGVNLGKGGIIFRHVF